ncbi:MAG: hypothetical protein IT331_23650 [Anaerolineae bacterium]|nr:hypothetical protein [Anaerolineae bacterium]
MHLIELLFQKNQLSGRKHVTPLGWVLFGIGVLFVGALIFGWYRQITGNVNMLEPNSSIALAEVVETAEPATPQNPHANNEAPNWTFRIVKTPLGVDAVEAPPEVTKAVLSDFDAALDGWDAHKFDLDYLKAHASDFFSGRQLTRMQGMLDWMQQEKHAVALHEYELLPLGRSVQYAPNGTQAVVIEYIAAGKTYEYDLKTRAQLDEQEIPDRIVMTEMSYDSSASRWKISRIALSMDLQTKKVFWQDR